MPRGKDWKREKSRGVSPVIAAVVLSAVVIAVGGAIWSYAQSAAIVMANQYTNETMTLLNEVIERFTVEHVSNNSDCTTLYVWIYNYGEVDVKVDVYSTINGETNSSDTDNPYEIATGEFVCSNVTITASSGDDVAIKVHSRRGNSVYYRYLVP